MRLAQEDSLVRKNARFAHDMVNFETMCVENVLARTQSGATGILR